MRGPDEAKPSWDLPPIPSHPSFDREGGSAEGVGSLGPGVLGAVFAAVLPLGVFRGRSIGEGIPTWAQISWPLHTTGAARRQRGHASSAICASHPLSRACGPQSSPESGHGPRACEMGGHQDQGPKWATATEGRLIQSSPRRLPLSLSEERAGTEAVQGLTHLSFSCPDSSHLSTSWSC